MMSLRKSLEAAGIVDTDTDTDTETENLYSMTDEESIAAAEQLIEELEQRSKENWRKLNASSHPGETVYR